MLVSSVIIGHTAVFASSALHPRRSSPPDPQRRRRPAPSIRLPFTRRSSCWRRGGLPGRAIGRHGGAQQRRASPMVRAERGRVPPRRDATPDWHRELGASSSSSPPPPPPPARIASALQRDRDACHRHVERIALRLPRSAGRHHALQCVPCRPAPRRLCQPGAICATGP